MRVLNNSKGTAVPSVNLDLAANNLPLVDPNHPLSQELMVEVAQFDIRSESFYARSDGLNAPYYRELPDTLKTVWCRKSVAEKLAEINQFLRPNGIELYVLDGYRPLEVQRSLWNYFMGEAARQLGNPAPEACREFAKQYVADPSNFNLSNASTWPPHLTGGALDLTLVRCRSNEQLFMGGVFDDPSEVSHTNYHERSTLTGSASHIEARNNRRLLYWSMIDAGFVNWPFEWWHFDYGNHFWAKYRPLVAPEEKELCGWYGPTKLPFP